MTMHERQQATSSAAKMTMAVIGIGCYWAWMNLSTANSQIFPQLVSGLAPIEMVGSSVTYAIALAVLFACGDTVLSRANRMRVTWAVAAFAIAAACVIVGNGGAAAGVIARSVLAACNAVALVSWLEYVASLGIRQASMVAAGSFAFGSASYLILSSARFFAIAVPVLIAVFHGLLLAIQARDRFWDRDPLPSPIAACTMENPVIRALAIICALVICAFLNEVIRIVSTPLAIDEFAAVGAITQAGELAVALAVLATVLISKRGFDFNAMSRVLLPLMIAGFLSFLVFSAQEPHIIFLILGAGYWCLNLFILLATADVAHRFHVSAVRLFSLVYLLLQMAIIAAKPVGLAISDRLAAWPSGIEMIVACSVLVIVVLAMALLRERGLASIWPERTVAADGERDVSGSAGECVAAAAVGERSVAGSVGDRVAAGSVGVRGDFSGDGVAADGGPSPKEQGRIQEEESSLARMARNYKLSPRETEVLELLAKGRTLRVVQEELVISLGTAQTHVRHIYEKCGVHNRQELIDLVEQAR